MGGSDNFIVNIAPIFIIFLIFYFFLIRPQQKKIKEHKIMVSALKRGDDIVTSGGIIGKVEKILGDDKIEVQISENVFIQVVQSTVQNVINKTPIKK
jgi:preprotein translocase subunit YajC